jgi:hypothetical protein
VTSTAPTRLRGVGVFALALALATLGLRPALAADTDPPPAPTAGDATADKPAPEPAAVPQAQVDDEGPSARVAKKVHHGFRVAPVATADVEEKPFWKNWVFWSVTGALVAGTVGAFIYSYSGTRGSAGPCPAGIQISLGCFGAGRN